MKIKNPYTDVFLFIVLVHARFNCNALIQINIQKVSYVRTNTHN